MPTLAGMLQAGLFDGLQRTNNALVQFGRRLYPLYESDPTKAGREFLRAIRIPRDRYKEYIKGEHLNPGSSAGLVTEWFLFHVIDEAIKALGPTDTYRKTVHNSYDLPYKWAKGVSRHSDERSHKQTRIDIAVKSENPTRLLYCIEVKTNFEDGFPKYCREWKPIHHHREKSYKQFRYHYVSLKGIPAIMMEKYKRRIKVLEKRGEMWLFPKDEPEGKDAVDRGERFLRALYEPLKYSGRD